MADAKVVVAPEVAVTQPPAPVTASDPVPPKIVVVFWKKMNPFEKIVFEDGSELVFGRQTFATADSDLIEKIKRVSGRYGILFNDVEK